MKYEYLQGFNDAFNNNTYSNPYNDNTQPDLFMQYHNGHNSGCWHKRTITQLTNTHTINILKLN